MNDGAVGYWFEEKVRLAFAECLKTKPIKAVRLYDSKSAGGAGGVGNWLPEQPGDMIWVIAGVPLLVEIKASDVTRSLALGYKKKMRAAQIGGARLWLRAGGTSIVIFCGRADGVVELWNGANVVEAWRNGWPKLRAEPVLAFKNVHESEVQQAMQSMINYLVETLSDEATYFKRLAPAGEAHG